MELVQENPPNLHPTYSTNAHIIPQLHQSIRKKLDGFLASQRIPHLLFHGSSGTGKRTIIYDFINKIYQNEKHKLKTNVMFVNCAHGKGIKFIRDELKFFAKTNIQGTQGILFKSIVLFNADSLTIDAQSALRRCIELFSYNTRFFIVVENKHKLLNPILSRFCEIYVPEHINEHGNMVNLHQHHLERKHGLILDNSSAFETIIGDAVDQSYSEWVAIVTEAYEKGLSCMDLIQWVKQNVRFSEENRAEIVMYFHKIRAEYRCEKLLMLCMLSAISNLKM
jgi:replication-associated recombination protein RarA